MCDCVCVCVRAASPVADVVQKLELCLRLLSPHISTQLCVSVCARVHACTCGLEMGFSKNQHQKVV